MSVKTAARLTPFSSAKPIWPENMETEKNLLVGFRAAFEAPTGAGAMLRVAASSIYRAFVNGAFLCHGPARGPHGHYRVDEWDLDAVLVRGDNLIAFEVAGYNVNGYYLLDQPAFLQAEVTAGGRVLASTAGEEGAAFEAGCLPERVRRVQRYSFQRPFVEVYRLGPGYGLWRRDPRAALATAPCDVLSPKRLIPRGVPLPRFRRRAPVRDVSAGRVRRAGAPEGGWKDPALIAVGPRLGGFHEGELEVVPTTELARLETVSTSEISKPLTAPLTVELEADSFRIVDFGGDLTGFVGATVECAERARLFFVFDELLTDGDVDFARNDSAAVVTYELEPGRYEVESIEPYTLRYLKLTALDGGCRIEDVHLREYANDDCHEARFAASDRELAEIFEAGRETFRQNAVDVFMDCPSRERAGWLCDSFFTARVERDLCGASPVERNFLENYSLPESFAHIPDGMLPMCYPSDHNNGNFIPNWAMWFVLQLEEYLARTGDGALPEALRGKVLGLFDYFAGFRNADGLLEKLHGWVFVEWSKANEFVQDVSYPTNMLYAAALDAAGRLYGEKGLRDQAAALRETVREQSFDGLFFVDNAVRQEGRLTVTANRTEACQYYAFFCGLAAPGTHGELWRILTEQFGPCPRAACEFPDVHGANLLIGDFLRLDLLSRYGLCAQAVEEGKALFLKMARATGTLWEHRNASASCNHGFASHAVHVLYRDCLGVRNVDVPGGKITLRFPDLPLDWCEGCIPLGDDALSVEWRREGREVRYRVRMPAGFSLEVEGTGDVELVAEA